MEIAREVALLDADAIADTLGDSAADADVVGYRTTNRVTNAGETAWTEAGGAPSIWLLGMFKPGDATTVVVPFEEADGLGPVVSTDYFVEVGPDRLRIKDGVIYFSGDGRYRSKIGVGPRRSAGVCGSRDPDTGVLTVVTYEPPADGETRYVKSQWKTHEEPYAGDLINSYNDGPTEPGGDQLGPFYELETSGLALFLNPGETGEHVQSTFHAVGPREALDAIAVETFGVTLETIEGRFDKGGRAKDEFPVFILPPSSFLLFDQRQRDLDAVDELVDDRAVEPTRLRQGAFRDQRAGP